MQTTQAEAAVAPPAEAKTAQIDMDGDALKNFTNLNRELREAKTKLKNTEERIAAFGRFEKAAALAKEGKHYDAAREAGIDVDAALAELLGQNNGQPTATQIDKKLADEIADLKKFKDDTIAEKEEGKKAAAAAEKASVFDAIEKAADKYPMLSKSRPWVSECWSDFEKAQATLETESGEKLSNGERAKLLQDALAVHEAKWAKAFGKEQPAPAADPAPGIDAAVRAGVRQVPEPTKKKLTFDELKAERLALRTKKAG